jgi:hypothetical protein
MAIAQIVGGNFNMSANFYQTQTTGNINSQGSTLNEAMSIVTQWVNNYGVNYGVDQLYAMQLTLASTTQTVHFQTATAKDPFGNTLAMLRIRALLVQNLNATLGQDLKVYAPSSNGITWLPPVANFIPVRPGGAIVLLDPLSFGSAVGSVVGASSDGVTFDSGSNTVMFNVLALGCATA